MRRHAVAIGLLAALAGPALMAAFVATPASADAPSATSWWYKPANSAAPAPPAPPNVPAGGLFVANDPTNATPPSLPPVPAPPPAPTPNATGPTAFATLRVTLAQGAPATLTLKVASGSTAQTADIVACPTTGPWNPVIGPGPYDKAPPFNCSTAAVPSQAAPDGSTMSWSLPATLQSASGAYDIALVPNPATQPPKPFEMAFDAPDASAFSAGAAAPPGSPPPGGSSSGSPGSSGSLGGIGAPAGPPAAPGGINPAVASALPPPAVAPGGSLAAVTATTAPGRAGQVALGPAAGSIQRPSRRAQLVAVLTLLALALGCLFAMAPGVLKGAAGPGLDVSLVRGIGRFARPRAGAPRSLR